jgi:hypothetical protein
MDRLPKPTRYRPVALLVVALACGPAAAQASPQGTAAAMLAPAALDFGFDYELAKLVSQAVATGDFNDAALAAIRAHPATAAMVRKMRLKSVDELVAYLRGLTKDAAMRDAARVVLADLGRSDGGKYGPLADDVTRQLAQYVPAQFVGRLKVYFIFGGNASGFAFDDDADDVYVNLARFTQASTQELAETVAHELFHAVQSHVMTTPPRPAPGTPANATGAVWMKRLIYDLVQEGTAELFTHPVADRPASAYSGGNKARIERNAKRIRGIITLFETTALRLRLAPPRDEDAYDAIYGMLFYGNFDEAGYDLGWLMATTIEKREGKGAIFALLKDDPTQFVLRYQAIAMADAALPAFGDEFIEAVKAQRARP